MPMPELSALHVYPVKGVRGTSPGEAEVLPWGLAADRRWMVVDADHRQVTQREQPQLALVAAGPLPGGGVELSAPGMPGQRVEVPGEGTAAVTVSVWRDQVPALPSAAGGEWFSACLGRPVLLVYLADPRARPVDPRFGRTGETVAFADGYPLLVTTTASLEALNKLVAEEGHADEGPLPMDRFRPNLVVSGTDAWAEDGWRRLRIGQVLFRVAKPCGRCVVTTTDQRTGHRGREPLRTLARHRRFGSQLVFGQNLVPESTGRVRSGDQVEVLDSAPPPGP